VFELVSGICAILTAGLSFGMLMYEIYRHNIVGKVCKFVRVCRQTRKEVKHNKKGFSKVAEQPEETLNPSVAVVAQDESSTL
jgi:hypothetical protein